MRSSRRSTLARRVDLVVIGGGAGGLAAARAGARRGRRTVLVSDGPLGGECTFSGCVPSKTLIEAASRGEAFSAAAARVRDVVERIAASEDSATLTREGVEVIQGVARFVGQRTIAVDQVTLTAEVVVVATGSRPALPAVPGLTEVPFLTTETVFELRELPRSFVVLGGGPVGCELAQAFRRFGSEVDLMEAGARLLAREEPEASALVSDALAAEGVRVHLCVQLERIEPSESPRGVVLHWSDGPPLFAEVLLVVAGREPRTAALNVEAGGIVLDDRGYIRTSRFLETSAPGVYAAGDVTGRLALTHAADEMGRLAVSNGFRRLGRRPFDETAVPSVVFCDPEVGRVGRTEAEAASVQGRVAYLPMSAVDRAIAASRTEGFVKLIAGPRPFLGNLGGGRLLGATIVAPRAGEMIHEVALAIRAGVFTGRLVQTVHAYPTWSTGVRQAAAQFFVEIDGRRARPAGRGGPESRPSGRAPGAEARRGGTPMGDTDRGRSPGPGAREGSQPLSHPRSILSSDELD
jgi:pyruvate/2-oxoglutarate dehydrogenase complex dihydrolipoamide dehydrogenase (E3) component